MSIHVLLLFLLLLFLFYTYLYGFHITHAITVALGGTSIGDPLRVKPGEREDLKWYIHVFTAVHVHTHLCIIHYGQTDLHLLSIVK